jgi:hypothetical protein
MSKYHDWLDEALARLSDDFCEGAFRPQNESDVKCHLYDSFISTKAGIGGLTATHTVFSEFPVPNSRERIDLAIVKKTKDADEPRLLLEIKETHLDHLEPDEVKNRVQPDMDKLLRYKMADGGRVVFFFFRGPNLRHGVGVRTNDCMEQLRREYENSDVILKWGPR